MDNALTKVGVEPRAIVERLRSVAGEHARSRAGPGRGPRDRLPQRRPGPRVRGGAPLADEGRGVPPPRAAGPPRSPWAREEGPAFPGLGLVPQPPRDRLGRRRGSRLGPRSAAARRPPGTGGRRAP